MFIKSLLITKNDEVIIRDITFKKGLNLIIDDTPIKDIKKTGNNIGKTTVLKLIDFCLGAKVNILYTDTENKKETYPLIKNFLTENNVLITLTLTEDLDNDESKEIQIKRNCLTGKKMKIYINGEKILNQDFDETLFKLLISSNVPNRPTFREIVSHNIRYKDDAINNTLKTLNRYTSDIDYSFLYLYLLGCPFEKSTDKSSLHKKLLVEKEFKKRLEKERTLNTYKTGLVVINRKINHLNIKKQNFNLNEDFEKDLDELNLIKKEIRIHTSSISKLDIRQNLILESKQELEESKSNIDLEKLEQLYNEVSNNILGLNKTFNDLVKFHNNMINEKMKFILEDLPKITNEINYEKKQLSSLLKIEKELTNKISQGEPFSVLENIINQLNEQYQMKGDFENSINKITEIDNNIDELNEKLENIDEELFSNSFEEKVKKQIDKFNAYFSDISDNLYQEQYIIKCEQKKDKKNRHFYHFSSFNLNVSSGKKQGEILCFDLAYILFADSEKLSCLHFLLNDKKELLHDNQFKHVAQLINEKNIQLIISILRSKIPEEIINESHTAVELAQNNKLFKIEN